MEENKGDRYRDRDTPRGSKVEVIRVGGDVPPLEENADLPGFTLGRVLLLLQGVYGHFLHHSDGLHLEGRVTDDALWQCCWRRLNA